MAPRKKTLRQVMVEGNLRGSLEAIRDRLADELERADGAAASALARELRMVLEKLEALPGGREVSKLDRIESTVSDELGERRAARQSDAANS